MSPELYVATEDFTFDTADGHAMVHAGAIVRAGHMVMKGHDSFFEPFTVLVAFDEDLPPTPATITVMGDGELASGVRRRFAIWTKAEPAELRW